MFTSILGQARAGASLLLLFYLPALFSLAAVAMASLKTGVPPHTFVRDPTTLFNAHPFTGIVSNVGVLFWCASATICLFTWSILRHRSTNAKFAKFLLYSGLLTTILLLDDFFLFHDWIFLRYFYVPEEVTYAAYGICLFCLIIAFKECILKTEYLIILSALGFLGLSIGTDAFQERIESFLGGWRILLEDGFKFFGIVGWFGYFFRCGFLAIRNIDGHTAEF